MGVFNPRKYSEQDIINHSIRLHLANRPENLDVPFPLTGSESQRERNSGEPEGPGQSQELKAAWPLPLHLPLILSSPEDSVDTNDSLLLSTFPLPWYLSIDMPPGSAP